MNKQGAAPHLLDLGIAGKRALVTAGSRGIGRACFRALAAAGARVATCGRSQDDLRALLAEYDGSDGHYTLPIDLLDEDSARTLAQSVLREFGSIDIVVHNFGGTLGVRDPYAPLQDWRRVWRANFEVALELNAMLVPSMVQTGWGRVVSISSAAAIEHLASLPYTTAKAALTAYTRSMGRTLAASGVVMTAVIPGIVLTEGGTWERAMRDDPERVAQTLKELPGGDFQRPEEIADFVAFLCSARASGCAGGLYRIDNGQSRSFFG